jgi:hypothetical protein
MIENFIRRSPLLRPEPKFIIRRLGDVPYVAAKKTGHIIQMDDTAPRCRFS